MMSEEGTSGGEESAPARPIRAPSPKSPFTIGPTMRLRSTSRFSSLSSTSWLSSPSGSERPTSSEGEPMLPPSASSSSTIVIVVVGGAVVPRAPSKPSLCRPLFARLPCRGALRLAEPMTVATGGSLTITGSTGTARTIADGRYGSTTFTTTGREPSVMVDPAAAIPVVVVGRGLCCAGGSCCVPVPAKADRVTAPTVRSRFGDIGKDEPAGLLLCGFMVDDAPARFTALVLLLIVVLPLLLLTLIAVGSRRLVPPAPPTMTDEAFGAEPTTEYGGWLCLLSLPVAGATAAAAVVLVAMAVDVMIVLLLMLLHVPLVAFVGLTTLAAVENVIGCILDSDRALGSILAVTGCTRGVSCGAIAIVGGWTVCLAATFTIVAWPLTTPFDTGRIETVGGRVLLLLLLPVPIRGVCAAAGMDCGAGATTCTAGGDCSAGDRTTGATETAIAGVTAIAGSGGGGGVGGVGLATVPAAPKNDPAYFRSPHIGSKCFSFHGSSLLFSRSASERIFSCASGVNSPSASRSRHSWQARAKNSLFSPDGFSRMPFCSHCVASGSGGRSTGGSSCTSLYWYSGGRS
uniref:Uncharacterized protein n=1 Tax=Anopheles merus TaxID=30066 RepID=A0A182V1Y8_ANOME